MSLLLGVGVIRYFLRLLISLQIGQKVCLSRSYFVITLWRKLNSSKLYSRLQNYRRSILSTPNPSKMGMQNSFPLTRRSHLVSFLRYSDQAIIASYQNFQPFIEISYLDYYGSQEVDQKSNQRSKVDLYGVETLIFNVRQLFKKLCGITFCIKLSTLFALRQVKSQQNQKIFQNQEFQTILHQKSAGEHSSLKLYDPMGQMQHPSKYQLASRTRRILP